MLVDTPDAAPRQLSNDDLLKLPDVLPGFSVRVREFSEERSGRHHSTPDAFVCN